MALFLNIIVLIFEILYYSLFMKFAKKEGKLIRYFIAFSLMTIVGVFIGTNNLPSYFVLIMLIIIGMKYIVKVKMSLYDVFIIVCMLFIKILIETPLYILLFNFIIIYIIGIIVNILKLAILFIIRNFLNKIYKTLKIKWDNNNFYIRYTFSICCFVYCIISAILLIYYVIK